MPIYEYYCPDDNRIYRFFARSHAGGQHVPRCPDNSKWRMVKLFSPFVIGSRSSEQDSEPAQEMDESRMEAMMSQLQHEMAGMDQENPDPRQMGHLMRRMADVSGEKIDDQMSEMINRLEAGEDPEKLEEQSGDAMDNPGPDAEGSGEPDLPSGRRYPVRRRAQPTRDPELYDLDAYI